MSKSDNNKLIKQKEFVTIRDKHTILREGTPKSTRITFIDDKTGKTIRVEHNSMVIAGAQFTACNHFDIEPVVTLPNYNTELGIENMPTMPDGVREYTYLYCCGTSGCGIEASQIYPVKYQSRIHPNYLIPFRFEDIGSDLNYTQREIYFGRKEFTADRRIAYYYKAFDSQPQMFLKYADGTQIDSNIYNVNSDQRATTVVEVRLKISKTDFRDWFFVKDTISNARINTLSLLTAWKYTDPDTGYTYYNNVRPLTQLNFSNEWLIDLTKSITIVYELFY